jgi:hypothetical protein
LPELDPFATRLFSKRLFDGGRWKPRNAFTSKLCMAETEAEKKI